MPGLSPNALLSAAFAGGFVLLSSLSPAQAAGEVNIYSHRQPFLINPMLDAFTKETGIKVNIVHADKGLIERMKQEGANSPADLFLTIDIGSLSESVQAGVTQPVETPTLTANVPAAYRAPDGSWYALSLRARAIYASKERIDANEKLTYEGLVDPKWKGRICTRSGKHVYQIGLLASMIAHHGEEKAEEWLKGLRANLAQKPQGNDRAQAKAIMEGVCDLAIMNNYYYAAMLANPEQVPWAESVRVMYPNQDDRGTHVNVSGVALTKSAPNKENAIKLMEFLSSEEAQEMYSELNAEYPVNPGVELKGVLADLGAFKADGLNLDIVSAYRGKAFLMVDRVGYDQ